MIKRMSQGVRATTSRLTFPCRPGKGQIPAEYATGAHFLQNRGHTLLVNADQPAALPRSTNADGIRPGRGKS